MKNITLHLMGRKIDRNRNIAVVTVMDGDIEPRPGDSVNIMDFKSNLKSAKYEKFVGYDQGLPVCILNDLKFRK